MLRKFVIPAQAGIHIKVSDNFTMDYRLRGNDDQFVAGIS